MDYDFDGALPGYGNDSLENTLTTGVGLLCGP